MPRPLGRDRLEPATDGTLVLLSLRPKSWVGREEVSARSGVLPGTAVRWDGEMYEVLRVEARSAGGYRHVLAPWDERVLVRSYVEYGEDAATGSTPLTVAPAVSLQPDATEESPLPTPAEVSADLPAGTPAPGGVAASWRALSPAVRALFVAFVPSVLLGWFFPFRVMGEGISFLVHELGHTLVAWFFGCSALPAIVMTIVFAQNRAVAAIVWGGLVFLAVKYRRAPRWNVVFVSLAVLYPFVAFTKAHVTAFDLGGHLAEAAFAAWAFRRAVRGERAEWERLVWAFFAFYLVARNVKLFGGVVLSAAARTDYLTIAITGQNDMVKVAATTGLALTTIAALAALFFLVVPLGALGLALRGPQDDEE
jgi:hypothetical protein